MEWGTPVYWDWFLLFSRSGGHKTKETYPTRLGSPTPCKQGLRRLPDITNTIDSGQKVKETICNELVYLNTNHFFFPGKSQYSSTVATESSTMVNRSRVRVIRVVLVDSYFHSPSPSSSEWKIFSFYFGRHKKNRDKDNYRKYRLGSLFQVEQAPTQDVYSKQAGTKNSG